MPSRSGPRGGVAVAEFSAREWDLLVRLPARVIVAATSSDARNPRRTVAEGLAGLEAVAAGRAFDSDLVREVVAAIYAERTAAPPTPDGARKARRGAPPHKALFAACDEAARVLSRRADPADSAAYRQWLQSIAARVRAAARSADALGMGGAQPTAAEREFLADLGRALRLG
jgi:hypothetical protein